MRWRTTITEENAGVSRRPAPANASEETTAGLFVEAGNRERFVVVGIEDGHQLRHLQHFLEFLAQVRQLQRGALLARAVERSHQSAEPRAVNVADVRKIQHDLLLPGREQRFHFLAKGIALFAQHDAPFDLEHGHAIHVTIRHSQCHVHPSSKTRIAFLKHFPVRPASAGPPACMSPNKSPSTTCNTRTPGKSSCSFSVLALPSTSGSTTKRIPCDPWLSDQGSPVLRVVQTVLAWPAERSFRGLPAVPSHASFGRTFIAHPACEAKKRKAPNRPGKRATLSRANRHRRRPIRARQPLFKLRGPAHFAATTVGYATSKE